MTSNSVLIRFIGSIFIFWFLAACQTNEPKNLDLRQGSADLGLALAPKDADGILVLGFQTKRHPPIHTMEFRSYDPATRRLIPEAKGAQVIRLRCNQSLFDSCNSAEKDGIRYLVQRLPAGTYYMTMVFAGYHEVVVSKNSVAIDIKPGVVNYTGNVRVDLPLFRFQDVRVRALVGNNAFVVELLQRYKDITAKTEFREATILKLDCDLDDGLKACY